MGKSGICRTCRNALGYHCRTYPDRLPNPGTAGRKALEYIKPAAIEGLKQSDIIMRLKGMLDAS